MTRAFLALCAVFVLVPTAAFAQFNDQWQSFVEDPAMIPGGAAYSSTGNETDLAWGDLDKDGFVDLVIVRKQPQMTTGKRTNILLMNINGVLTNQTSPLANQSDVSGDNGFLTATNDRDVIVVDVDNDGWLDVVTAATLSDGDAKHLSHPRVYMNLGDDVGGNWLGLEHQDARIPQLLHHTSGAALDPRFNAVAAGDVNNDGFTDLYFGDSDTGPPGSQGAAADPNDRLLLNDGNGNFIDSSTVAMTTQMLKSNFCSSVNLVDLNGDGALDVLKQSSHNTPTNVYAAYNNPLNQGVFASHQQFYGNSPYYVSTGDLNNDGRLDMVTSDNGSDKYLYNLGNDGNSQVIWSAKQTYSFLTGSDDGFGGNNLVVDLDQDGWNDVIVADVDVELSGYNRRLHIYHNRGGTVGGTNIVLREERQAFSSAGWLGVEGMFEADMKGTFDFAVFDIDNDGRNDLVLSRSAGTEVWRNTSPGGPVCQTDLGFGNGSSSLSVCGGDLSSGNDATMTLEGAPGGTLAILFAGLTANPTPVPELGFATLVPVPAILTLSLVTNPAGEISFTVPGGLGSISTVVQYVVQLTPTTYEVSNAVQIELQP